MLRAGIHAAAVLCLLPLLLFAGAAFAQELPFTNYTQESELNPLPSADVRSIYQDHLGYLWFVIYSSGLLRYDGHAFDTYAGAEGLAEPTVRQVLEDSLGRLWVATNSGLYISDRPLDRYGTGERIRFARSIGSTPLVRSAVVENRLAVDRRGWFWVGTRESGIIRYRPFGADSVAVDTIATGLAGEVKNRDVRSLAVRRDGSVWAGVGGGPVLVFRSGEPRFEVLGVPEGLPSGTSTDVFFEDHGGRLLGGCRSGLLWVLDEKPAPHVTVVDSELHSRISAIAEESDGTMWLSSSGSGVLRMEPGNRPASGAILHAGMLVTSRNGLLGDNVNNLTIDREGDLWFAQSGGASKLRPNYRAFANYSAVSRGGARPFLTNGEVNAVCTIPGPGGRRDLWVGTSTGGITVLSEDSILLTMGPDRGLRSAWVYGISTDERGRIWIACQSGINCISTDPHVPAPPSPSLEATTLFGRRAWISAYCNNTIYNCLSLTMPADSTGTRVTPGMWFPGYQSLYCCVGDEWYVFRSASGLTSNAFTAAAFDREGYLWVGTRDAGLYRSRWPLTLDRLRKASTRDVENPLGSRAPFGREIMDPVFEPSFDRRHGLPSNQIETMLMGDDALWVGTFEGLVALEGRPLAPGVVLTARDGLGANNATSLGRSPVNGNLWVGTNGGLSEVDVKTRRVIRTVTKHDGLLDNEVWASASVFAGADGMVAFGTAKGVAIYRPAVDRPNLSPPLLRFEQASLRQDDFGNNELTLRYAALSYSNEHIVRYRTRLIGYDTGWSQEGREVRLRYTNLGAFLFPKTYTFAFTACNNSGVWADHALESSFDILPPWWQRWWWVMLNVVLLGGIVIGVSRYRTRQLHRRSRELERIVEQRTHEIRLKADENLRQAEELAATNRVLEEKNEEIVRTQEQLVMQEKLASLGALTAGIAHEIKNPLNFVNNFAELSAELLGELRADIGTQEERIDSDTLARIRESLSDLEHNALKINEHGKRADSIVRGMLMHSRGKSGERMPTDVNALLEEYVNLAYHGLRAQDSNFNIAIKRDYDPDAGQIDAVPQDLSRVFLNIVNNACYAANERKKEAQNDFVPTLTICTRNGRETVEVRIRDNGKGIPASIRDKIFEPFFTTKPTGKGTGLGLSLSYDIVKQHHGDLTVDTREGEYTEFIIRLPKHHLEGHADDPHHGR